MDANAANSPLASLTANLWIPTSGARGMEDVAGGFGRMKIRNAKRLKGLWRQDVKHGSDGTNRLGHGLSWAARAGARGTAGAIIVPRRRAFRMARDIFMSNAQGLSQDRRRLSCEQQKEHNASHAPKKHARAKGLGQGGEQHRRRCAKSRKPAPTGQASMAGKALGWTWMDPIMGMVGGLVIARWSLGLLRQTSAVLLDGEIPEARKRQLRELIEADGDNRGADLHVWRGGSSPLPFDPADLERRG